MVFALIGLVTMTSLMWGVFQYTRRQRTDKIANELIEENKLLKNEMVKVEIETQERERRVIGRDLHDELGSTLLTIKMNLGLVEKQGLFLLDSNEALGQIKYALNGAIEYVKGISRVISPAFLENFGLSRSVIQIVKHINTSCVAKVDFVESGDAGELSKEKQLHIFRIIQEVLNNALRHASPWRIVVTFLWNRNDLIVEIKDDGYNHLSRKYQSAGLGLNNIMNRTSLIGAEFSNENMPIGNLVRIRIPYEKIPQQTTEYLPG